ncbi:tyrosine-type recombinase/integrase [Mesorhizobium yinganensis]|uniref:tyrosine-type recombinase/integrase n=1 Tax=Mesorhizobium yinganensis TaxID=3157707 RepID=UPI0032B715EE
MASIIERKKKDGKSSFMAQIVIKRDGKIAHRENKTFPNRREAVSWGKLRKDQLSDPATLTDATRTDPTLAGVIDRYINESKRLGRTKLQVLNTLKGFDLAAKRCSQIRSEHLVALARHLAETRDRSTVSNYMLFLSGVFTIARPAWGYSLDQMAMKDALAVASKLELTGRSNRRDRRPTVDEMNRLMAFFCGRKADSLPMAHVTAFAMYSTRRQAEITRLRWPDLDEAHSRILVRDMKDPGGAAGNDVYVDLPPEALRIVRAMPRVAEEIFPFNSETVSWMFREACKVVGINTKDTPDEKRLKFHDLRHEGVSRLFEMSMTIPQVAVVSGHRSWQNLQRYSHLRATGDKWANWEWLGKIAPILG